MNCPSINSLHALWCVKGTEEESGIEGKYLWLREDDLKVMRFRMSGIYNFEAEERTYISVGAFLESQTV